MTATIRSYSPQRPADLVGEWRDGRAHGIDAAVDRGRRAAAEWRRAPAAERSRALEHAAQRLSDEAEDLAQLVVREVGKPVGEARAEVARAAAILRFYAQVAYDAEGDVLPPSSPGSLLLTRRRPRGLVGLITPWNFPVAISTWKLAPAIAYGNAVVLKPSPDGTACAVRLAEALELPDDVLQVVPGAQEAGQRLVAHPDVDALSFTGSAAVGREVVRAATDRGAPVQAEMGGQNPCIVLADADVESAAATIASSAMGYAGQKCTAARRLIAVGDAAAITDALVAEVERLPVGDPSEPETVVGPLITDAARVRVAGAVERARAGGARVLTGGGPIEGDGWFLSPAVVAGVAPGDELAEEEVFGPVCAVLAANDLEEAVRLANATRYGLVAAVFTRDLGLALDVASRLEAGLVRVNAPTTGVDFHAPFGGDKASGIGPREQGRAARDFYTSTATITIAPPP